MAPRAPKPRAPKSGTPKTGADSAPSRRRMRGFEAAATLVAPQIKTGAESRGFAIARLLTNWAEIAGADTAAHTRPVRISHGRGMGATLTVLTDGAHAPLVQMSLPMLRERVNAVYGFNAISRITVTQTAPQGFAEGQAAFTPAPRGPLAASDRVQPADLAAADALSARFTDPALAAAMHRLALNRAASRMPGRKPISSDRKAIL